MRWRSSSSPFVIVSDASLQGFGFYLESLPALSPPPLLPASLALGSAFLGTFDAIHAAYTSSHQTIAWCELFSVLVAVAMYAPHFSNHSVLLVLDNETDVHVINRQSTGSPRLALLLRALYDLANRFNFDIHATHRPGVDNVLADYLSRPSLRPPPADPLSYWPSYLLSRTPSTNAFPFPALSSISPVSSAQLFLAELTPIPPPHRKLSLSCKSLCEFFSKLP